MLTLALIEIRGLTILDVILTVSSLSLVALVALVIEVIVLLLALTLDGPGVRVVGLLLNKVKGSLLNKVKGGNLAKEEIIKARRLRETLTILA